MTAKGGSVGHPDHFEVERKDGSKSYYGNSPDSQLATSDNAYVLSWAINQFQDSVQNSIHFIYDNDASGQRISEVRYAYGSATGPAGHGAHIAFTYGDRGNIANENDNISGYVAGYLFETTKRLTPH